MSPIARVFGFEIPVEAVTDCRVTRARAGGLSSVAVGSKPTWLKVVLHDGRVLEAQSRGPGPEEDAIEAAVAQIESAKAAAASAALGRGERVPFGDVALSPTGVHREGETFAWSQITHWDVDLGYLVLYPLGQGTIKLWLANIPFSGSLVELVARTLPGKRIDPAAKAAASATTGRVLLGLVGAAIVVTGLVYGVDWVKTRRRRAEWEAAPRGAQIVDEALVALGDWSATSSLPACPRVDPEYSTVLVAADKTNVLRFSGTTAWTPAEVSALDPATKEFFVWRREGAAVRVISYRRAERRAICSALYAVRAGADPAGVASLAAMGYPEPPASATSTATSATAETKPKPRTRAIPKRR